MDVPHLYHYGFALERIGDEYDASEIKAFLGREKLLPHQNNWLYRIVKAIDKQWRSTTSKWPEPWIRLDGVIECGEAEIRMQHDQYDATITVCATHRKDASSYGSWFAVVQIDTRGQFTAMFKHLLSSADLEIVGKSGHVSRAVFSRTLSADSFIALGSGTIPKLR